MEITAKQLEGILADLKNRQFENGIAKFAFLPPKSAKITHLTTEDFPLTPNIITFVYDEKVNDWVLSIKK